jgi:hypothetical protein
MWGQSGPACLQITMQVTQWLLPLVYLRTSQSFVSLEGCTLIMARWRPLINGNTLDFPSFTFQFHKTYVSLASNTRAATDMHMLTPVRPRDLRAVCLGERSSCRPRNSPNRRVSPPLHPCGPPRPRAPAPSHEGPRGSFPRGQEAPGGNCSRDLFLARTPPLCPPPREAAPRVLCAPLCVISAMDYEEWAVN